MKGGQLPDLPPEVKAARDTLAAWLEHRPQNRARAIGRARALLAARPSPNMKFSGVPQDPEAFRMRQEFGERQSLTAKSHDLRDSIRDEEAAILSIVRPDLSPEDCATAADALVTVWIGRGRRPNTKDDILFKPPPPRSPVNVMSAGKTIDPRTVDAVVTAMLKEIEKDPEPFCFQEMIDCLRRIDWNARRAQDAILKARPGR